LQTKPKGAVAMKSNILVVSSPSPITGGDGLRALRSIREYSKHFQTHLFIPWELWGSKSTLKESIVYIESLRSTGVKIVGFSQLPTAVHRLREVLGTRTHEVLLSLAIPNIAHLSIGTANYNTTVVLHEYWAAVYSGYTLANLFNTPSIVLLQSPPFYGSRERFANIVKALTLWRKLTSNTPIEKLLLEIETITRSSVEEYMRKLRYKKILKKYTAVLGISKAIAVEMGGEWMDRVYCFNPGVSLDEEDIKIAKSIRKRVKEKQSYIVLGGRPSADKGLADALISFRAISKHLPELKLVVTGRVAPATLLRVESVCRKLGIEGKVIFTGFVPREKRFEIVAKAKLVLYPSHIDSFSYAVLESLHLGTPVVGYRIPALEIHYGKCSAVHLVEEGDIEALTIKAIEILKEGVESTEPPKIKSWGEIMNEEIEIITKVATR